MLYVETTNGRGEKKSKDFSSGELYGSKPLLQMKNILTLMFFMIGWAFFADNIYLPNSSFEKEIKAPWHGEYKRLHSGGIDNSGCVKLVDKSFIEFALLEKNPLGQFYKFSVMAKGKGNIELKVYSVVATGNKKVSSEKTVALLEDWQKIELQGQENNVDCLFNVIMIKACNGSAAFLDDIDFSYIQVSGMKIVPSSVVAAPGEKLDIKVFFSETSKCLNGAVVKFVERNNFFDSIKHSGDVIRKSESNIEKNGVCSYGMTVPKNFASAGICLNVYAPRLECAGKSYISVFPEKEITPVNKTASKIKLKKPCRILYIGDSLTDRNRGYNYTDMIDYFLNKYNPNMASFKNAGVGGDFISRVLRRIYGMTGGKPEWRQYMYDGLLSHSPDIVFIFLGHNDTKGHSSCDYRLPMISPDIQYKEYRKLIDFFRQNTKADIVLISNSSSYFPAQLKIAQGKKKEGKPHALFGMERHLVNFNNTLKLVAQDEKLDYIDVYTPSKNYHDKKSLFVTDGIHLSERGNLFIAGKILEYLEGKYKSQH
jgi:lysophospholipase L1-like esterase